MVYTLSRKIHGKVYKYAVESVRMPDSSIKKISLLLNPKKLLDAVQKQSFFDMKKKELLAEYALNNYSYSYPLNREDIIKVEHMRADYKKIISKLSEEQRRDLFDRFTVNFTYESNALEGNSLTLKDVAIIISEKSAVKGKELREIYETRNSRTAMDMLLARKVRISHESIISLHRSLMRDIDVRAGYKEVPNFILGSELKTTPPEKVYAEMDSLIKWYHANRGKLHPIHLIARFHGRFTEIHPFEDGNGRVGRFLINAILLELGYPLLIIRKSSRVAYLNCLHAFDHHSEAQLTRFLLEKFKETYFKFFEMYIKYV
jgi:fido (protein-threonine AMPylation protein)